LEFERERRFGVYHVDAYVPSHNLVFEADGEWGHSPARDAARDRYLVRGGVVAVIRLVRDDLAPFMERT
jgi:very-short-patch-repair endonuclease